ncbi:acetate/propionate family kinase [Paludibacterium yongneupense]|uniref:acetate/propionate family kinase n=1 Tax=Paludibacterium yongneupense TaxID=400061 RepID=UPI0004277D52|nr:acetate/propionate family kinase [Paludibacterium yongneupense]
MPHCLLAVNAGSATLKFRAYRADGETLLLSGMVDRFGSRDEVLLLQDAKGVRLLEKSLPGGSREEAVGAMLNALADHKVHITAVAHRVVHGGASLSAPVYIDDDVRHTLEGLIALAPLHQPVSLSVIDAFTSLDPGLKQIACFDTAFHTTQPPLAQRFGIARHWHDEGVRRYGFHGLSFASIVRRFPEIGLSDSRVVVCHLGSGSSACAIANSRSVAASTGFSAVDGLMMSTRPGSLDPEVLLYWMEHEGMGVPEVRRELYKNSGLLGVSGLSADVRVLLASQTVEAREAVDLFCYLTAREVASLACAMKGMDALVFTAGIGEHSPEVRARVVQQLSWLGFELDHAANLAQARCITTPASRLKAFRLQTDEEGEMARLASALLHA